MLIYDEGYTFRARYFDYKTSLPEFQIDIIFRDDLDLFIDNLQIKNRQRLLQQREKRMQFNQKVDSGEIPLPPPPPVKNKDE